MNVDESKMGIKENSTYITKFLKKIFLDFGKKNKVVDFFIETYFDSQIFPTSGQISNIIKEFPDCNANTDIRKNCYDTYSKLRYHYADYRRYIKALPYENLDNDMIKMTSCAMRSTSRSNGIEILKGIIYEYYNRDDIDKSKYIKELVGFIFKEKKIKKNFKAIYGHNSESKYINNTNYTNLQEAILNNMDKRLEEYFNNLITIYEDEDEYSYEQKLNEILTLISSMYMDVYLLCRVFRKFVKPTYSGIHQDDAKNIIIVAGSGHIERYVRFLRDINYDIIFKEKIDANTECINISNINIKKNMYGGNFDEVKYNPLLYPDITNIDDIKNIAGPNLLFIMTNKERKKEYDIERVFFLIGDAHTYYNKINCLKSIDTKKIYLEEFDKLEDDIKKFISEIIVKDKKGEKIDIDIESIKLSILIDLYDNNDITLSMLNRKLMSMNDFKSIMVSIERYNYVNEYNSFIRNINNINIYFDDTRKDIRKGIYNAIKIKNAYVSL